MKQTAALLGGTLWDLPSRSEGGSRDRVQSHLASIENTLKRFISDGLLRYV